MKNIKMTLLTFSIAWLLALPVLAQPKNAVEVKNEAFKEVRVVKADGTEEYKLIAPGQALPGDEIVYVTTFKNVGDKDVTDIVLTDPVPNNSLYKSGSAFGAGTEITFSVDGGKTYAKAEALKVADRKGGVRAATAEDYTTIRWVFRNILRPGSSSTVMFRTFVK